MNCIKYIGFLVFLILIRLTVGAASAQTYRSFSLGAHNLGYNGDYASGFFVSPRLSIGKSNFQVMLALELPTRRLAADDKWAGITLRPGESVQANRYMAKFRLKSQPQENSLGIVWLAVNQYLLDIRYQDPAVFFDSVGDTIVYNTTLGAGFFEFWSTNSSLIKAVGAETILFTDFDKYDLWVELKALFPRNIKIGFVAESGRPRPQFSDFYFSFYLEYVWRW